MVGTSNLLEVMLYFVEVGNEKGVSDVFYAAGKERIWCNRG